MFIECILILIGFVLLIKGADYLVDGASFIAVKFKIPKIIIGLTVVSIGTSMPEMFVSVTSALNGHNDLAIGNVIGSNLCNLLLILGISTMIRNVKFPRETRMFEIPMTLGVTVILFMMCNIGNDITRFEGYILLLLFLCFILYTIYMGIKGNTEEQDIPAEGSIIKSVLFMILGICGLKFGGDFVVNGAVFIAELYNIPEKIIALTIVSIGTSLPELVTSVTAACKGDSDIAIGNILGSNIFNILLILGVFASITPITYSISYNVQLFILIASTIILALFPYIGVKNEMTRLDGMIYLGMYVMYMTMLIMF